VIGLCQPSWSIFALKFEVFVITDRVYWSSRTAEDFLYITQLALQTGAYITAHEIASAGARRFPRDAKLVRRAYVLAPPRILGKTPVKPEEAEMQRRNMDWLRNNSSAHIGKWVALRNGELLAEGELVRDVVAKLGNMPPQSVLLTQVF